MADQNPPPAPSPKPGVSRIWLLPTELLLAIHSILGLFIISKNYQNLIMDQVNLIQDLIKGQTGGLAPPGLILAFMGLVLSILWARFYASAVPHFKILLLETAHLKGLPDIISAIAWTAFTLFTMTFVMMNIYAAGKAIF